MYIRLKQAGMLSLLGILSLKAEKPYLTLYEQTVLLPTAQEVLDVLNKQEQLDSNDRVIKKYPLEFVFLAMNTNYDENYENQLEMHLKNVPRIGISEKERMRQLAHNMSDADQRPLILHTALVFFAYYTSMFDLKYLYANSGELFMDAFIKNQESIDVLYAQLDQEE